MQSFSLSALSAGASDVGAYVEFITKFLQTPLETNPDSAMFFRAAVYSIVFLSSEDPSHLHYQAAREVLRESGGEELEGDEKARDLLARALVKECQLFARRFLPLSASFLSEKIFSEEGPLSLDQEFASHIAFLGPHGKQMSQALLAASISWKEAYEKDQNALSLFRLWVDFDIPPYYCRYLKLFAEILWKDRIEALFQKSQKHLPALTLSVQRPLHRLFSSHISVNSEKSAVLSEGKVIAEVTAHDSKFASLLAKGIHSFGSIYHHKLLRYECEKGYENWLSGKQDPQIIRFERGETEIAEKLGFKFKEAPAIIKSLLYAQSHLNFHFDDQSKGPLIELKEFTSPSTRREEGVELVLSAQLMPNYTFQTDRKGKLLVPLAKLPPFVSAPQYHAGQALLQMLIMEEFTNHSIDLASSKAIEITEEKWEEFHKKSGLPKTVFQQARYRWLSDGDDGEKFLVQVEKNHYTLSEAYAKELKFLQAQGTIRRERQLQAQVSVRKRRSVL